MALRTINFQVSSKVAKVSDPMEVIAALGIVFYREMLMIGAEDTFEVTMGRALVQETVPGNYDGLAGRIGAEHKPRRLSKRRESYYPLQDEGNNPIIGSMS